MEKICLCFEVYRDEIEQAIAEHKLTTREEVTEATGAGGGCGRCRTRIQSILDNLPGCESPIYLQNPSANAETQ